MRNFTSSKCDMFEHSCLNSVFQSKMTITAKILFVYWFVYLLYYISMHSEHTTLNIHLSITIEITTKNTFLNVRILPNIHIKSV